MNFICICWIIDTSKRPTPPVESSGVDTDPQKSVPMDPIASNMMRMGIMMLDANSGLSYDENVSAIEGIKNQSNSLNLLLPPPKSTSLSRQEILALLLIRDETLFLKRAALYGLSFLLEDIRIDELSGKILGCIF